MAKLILYDSPRALISPTKETINGFVEAIRWAEVEVPRNLPREMHKLVYAMALINQREARKMSFGPRDRREQQPGLAWKLPVRRITEAYYLGWKIRFVRQGVIQLYNDSREGYFIEFGINHLGEGRRVRRPIRKLSLRRTMNYMATTHAFDRIWVDVFKTRSHSRGFTQEVQSPAGGHTRWEPISAHQAGSVISGNARKGRGSPDLRRSGNLLQRRVGNRGGGSFGGPALGREIP